MDSLSRKKEWAAVALDPNLPLNNRAISGVYPPGSTFKLFTSVAGLETGSVTMDGRPFVPCTGGYRFGARFQHCWDLRGHGTFSMIDANRESCDVYFYQLGLMMGMGPINKYAGMYGLGRRSFVDLPGERRGLLVDSANFNKRNKRLGWTWTRGLILNLAIGQGELVTPLQIANSFGALAEGKHLWQPHFLKAVRDSLGKYHFVKPQVLQTIKIKPTTQVMIDRALEEVVSAPMGTGIAARVPGIRVGGKTGSAENPQGKLTHAWFAGVAPLGSPRIAIAVVLENAGHGGSVAAPIAAKVLKHFFSRDSGVVNGQN
jgi:penicillin-binding protein 2